MGCKTSATTSHREWVQTKATCRTYTGPHVAPKLSILAIDQRSYRCTINHGYLLEEQKSHADPALGSVTRPVVREQSYYNGNNDVGNAHQSASDDQERAPTEPIHRVEACGYANELCNVEHARHDQLHVEVQSHILK